MDRHDKFNGILASLHEAMLDDSLWPAASVLIDEAVDINGSHLVISEGLEFHYQQLRYRGEGSDELERWFLEHAMHDVRIPRIYGLPHGRVAHVRELYTDDEIKTSYGFNEVLAMGGAQNGLNVRMDVMGGMSVTWVLTDPSGDRVSWDSEQLALVEGLLPHIRQFARVRQVLANAEAMGATLAGLLDQTGVGVLHLDQKGRIVESNAPADAILVQDDGLCAKGRQLTARLKADNTRLEKLLAAAIPGPGPEGVSGSMMIHRWPVGGYALHVCPVHRQNAGSGLAWVAAVVFIVDPAAQPRLDPERVATVLGLTPAEGQVATALAQGLSVRDIAATTHRNESTVRWTIKRIHAKLEVTRQADLVRMVLAAAGGVAGGG